MPVDVVPDDVPVGSPVVDDATAERVRAALAEQLAARLTVQLAPDSTTGELEIRRVYAGLVRTVDVDEIDLSEATVRGGIRASMKDVGKVSGGMLATLNDDLTNESRLQRFSLGGFDSSDHRRITSAEDAFADLLAWAAPPAADSADADADLAHPALLDGLELYWESGQDWLDFDIDPPFLVADIPLKLLEIRFMIRNERKAWRVTPVYAGADESGGSAEDGAADDATDGTAVNEARRTPRTWRYETVPFTRWEPEW